MGFAELILISIGCYGAVGAVFGLMFVTLGVARVDSAARGAPMAFRLAILPGSAALWPICLRKWIRSRP